MLHSATQSPRLYGARASCDQKTILAPALQYREFFLRRVRMGDARCHGQERGLPPVERLIPAARRWYAKSARLRWYESGGYGSGRNSGAEKPGSELPVCEKP